MIPVDPSGCARKIIDVHGQTGVAWLARLPALVADVAARWSLIVLPPFPELSYNYVAPVMGPGGAPLVLKAGVPHRELWDEMDALRLYDGRGIAHLVAAEMCIRDRAAPESVTRVGIIGCGNISSAYIDGCRMFDFLRVSAVADIAAEAAQSKAAEHDLALSLIHI